MSQEEKDLATHVEICTIRYQGIQEKIDALEKRMVQVENSIDALKESISQGFADIKLQIQKDNNRRSIQIIASLGTVVVAIIGALGVWLTHH